MNSVQDRDDLAEHEQAPIDIASFLQHLLTRGACLSQSLASGQIDKRYLPALLHWSVAESIQLRRFDGDGHYTMASTRISVQLMAVDAPIAVSLFENGNEFVGAAAIDDALVLNEESIFDRPSHKQTI
jgi:hypothetical protein